MPSRRTMLGVCAVVAHSRLRANELRQLLPPQDDLRRDPGLTSLVDALRKAVASRDSRVLESQLPLNFRVEFDVGKGPKAFHEHWRPEAPDSLVWSTLGRLLSLGGTFYSDSLFAIPYVYTQFPGDLDLLSHVVAIRDNVQLLEMPEAGAPRVGSLRFEIVPLVAPLAPPAVLTSRDFVELRHPEAGRCYAAASDMYSPAGHRAFFEKKAGRWHWISLAAGTLADPPELLHAEPGDKRDD